VRPVIFLSTKFLKACTEMSNDENTDALVQHAKRVGKSKVTPLNRPKLLIPIARRDDPREAPVLPFRGFSFTRARDRWRLSV
jgi:hypothetical protein